MSTAIPLEGRSAPESKTAAFGTASLVCALLTITLPVLMMILFGYKATQEGQNANNGGWGDLVAILLIFAGVVFAGIVSGLSSLAGTITGVMARPRGTPHVATHCRAGRECLRVDNGRLRRDRRVAR